MNKEQREAMFSELLDEHFPKGKCKERGNALVLAAEVLIRLFNDENQPQGVIANPYAQHEMNWSTQGTGFCREFTARPDGKSYRCGEPLESPVHGVNVIPWNWEKKTPLVHFACKIDVRTHCDLAIVNNIEVTDDRQKATCESCLNSDL